MNNTRVDARTLKQRFSRGGTPLGSPILYTRVTTFVHYPNKGYRMLRAGILNTLFTRMDLPYATQLRCTSPPDIPLEGEEYPWDIMLLIMKLLWTLMRSVLSPNTLPKDLKDLPALKQCAMWYYLLIIYFNITRKI